MKREDFRVLIAEDDPTLLEMCAETLTGVGYRVERAVDGGRALMLGKTGSYDVILADIHMPVVTGVQLLREIKSLNLESEVILMTGDASIDSAVEATKLGAFDYLLKPFEQIEQIVEIVDKAVTKIESIRQKDDLLDEMANKTKQLLRELQGSAYLHVDDGESTRKVKLDQDRITVGSSQEALVRIPNSDILPTHAHIYHDKDGWKIIPKGAIFINSKRVKESRLLETGTRISLNQADTITIEFVEMEKVVNVDHAAKSVEKVLHTDLESRTFKLEGRLDEMGLAELLQLISMLGKSGELAIHSDSETGRVFFINGHLAAAKLDKVANEKALFRLFLWEHGQFEFMPRNIAQADIAPVLDKSIDALVLDTVRQVDEYKNLGNQIPSNNLRLTLRQGWREEQGQKDPFELLVAQTVFRYNYVGLVLDRLDASDLEIIKTLIELRQNGALIVCN